MELNSEMKDFKREHAISAAMDTKMNVTFSKLNIFL